MNRSFVSAESGCIVPLRCFAQRSPNLMVFLFYMTTDYTHRVASSHSDEMHTDKLGMTIDTVKTLPFDEATVREIIRHYPTPFYLYDERGIRQNARRLN